MPTPQEVRDAVDSRLASLWNTIQTRQDAYYATHSRYWQGLKTHAVTPAEGVTVPPTVGTSTPSDHSDPWPASIRNTPIEMALEMHTYRGPLGHGYVAIVQVSIGGRTWERVAQVGPETWRARGWTRLEPLS